MALIITFTKVPHAFVFDALFFLLDLKGSLPSAWWKSMLDAEEKRAEELCEECKKIVKKKNNIVIHKGDDKKVKAKNQKDKNELAKDLAKHR